MTKRTTFSFALSALVVGGIVLAGGAQAAPCGEVTTAGSCDGNRTLVYCQNDMLVRLECPATEVCVSDDARFQGAAGCVAASLAGCGDIDESGACDSKDTVVFCDAREVKKRVCPSGTSCGWVEDEGWYDCVSNHLPQDDRFARSPEPQVPAEPGDGEPGTDTTEEPPDSGANNGPTQAPSVAAGGAPAAGEYEATGSGCGAGTSSDGVGLLLALGLVLAWRLGRVGHAGVAQ